MVQTRVWVCSGVALAFFVVGALLLSAGFVVKYAVFPKLLKNGVKDGKVLGLNGDGTFNDFTQSWAFPNYISTMQYWTFDYKNTIGIMNRAIYPDVIEKGPYGYKETLINSKISFTPDGEQMHFAQATQFTFDPSRSCPDCNPFTDIVTVPDISFTVVMDLLDAMLVDVLSTPLFGELCTKLNKTALCSELATIIEKEIGTVFDMFDTGPFVPVTVDQLLFSGYQSPIASKVVNRIISIINTMLGTQLYKPLDPNDPRFLVQLNSDNGTADFLYTVLTGKDDYLKSGYILSFKNNTPDAASSIGDTLPASWWPSANKGSCKGDNASHALKIDGTNADFFTSFIEKTDSLPIYIEDVCRSARLTYDREVTVQDIKGYRYVLPSSEFDFTIPDNCGYCTPLKYGFYDRDLGSSCLPSGLLDISNCQRGNPIVISKPHFYQAEAIAQQFVPRFKPNYDDDETTLDIEPLTGTVLSANKKLQINMLLNQYPRIGAYSVMRPGAYPLVWLNESFVMDGGTKNQLMSQLFTPRKIVNIACWTAVGVGGFLMCIGVLIMFVQFFVAGPKSKKET